VTDGCLREETITELLAGKLGDDAKRRVEAHLGGCPSCRARVGHRHSRQAARDEIPTMIDGRKPSADSFEPTRRMVRPDKGWLAEVAMPQSSWTPGTVIGGRYRLIGHLASGGMADVWRAVDTQLEVPVAVKLMGSDYLGSPEARVRFEREAKAAARLRTPHVVGIQGYGVDGNTPYIAMELLDGEDLDSRLQRRGRLPLLEAAELLRQAARGLGMAHAGGIVHRDLKPSNVFIANVDGQEVVKILDFGIAKATAEFKATASLTRTGQLIGTLHYMSPEQAIGDRSIDHRSDLWSLAMILYRVVTGREAVECDDLAEGLNIIIAGKVPAATSVAPDLPPALDAFFARAFSFSRDVRFQAATDLANEFSHIADATSAGRAARSVPPPPEPPAPPPIPAPLPLPLQPTAQPRPNLAQGTVPMPIPYVMPLTPAPMKNMPTMVRAPQPAQHAAEPSKLLPWLLAALLFGAIAAAAVVFLYTHFTP
jgi:eukaryotic-like serine/threonine-protein kinase